MQRKAKNIRKTYFMDVKLAKKAAIEAINRECNERDIIEAALNLYFEQKEIDLKIAS